MILLKKAIFFLAFSTICGILDSQNVILDTTFSYLPNADKYDKIKGIFHVVRKTLPKEGLEITEFYLTHSFKDGSNNLSKVYFTNNPQKIIFDFLGKFSVLDIERITCKGLDFDESEVMSFGARKDIRYISDDGKYLLGTSVFKGLCWEYNSEKETIVSGKKALNSDSGFFPNLQFSPSNSNFLYYVKRHSFFVYDIIRDEEVKKYNLNCKINSMKEEDKTSFTATQADMDYMENKLNNLEAINSQDLNSFGQDFIAEGVLNLLNSIPSWPDIHAYALQPNGNKLVVAYLDYEANVGINELFVWKVSATDPTIINAEKPWTILTGHTSVPGRILFSRDGRYLATYGKKEGILWDANTGRKISKYTGYPNEFSPDGELLMTSTTSEGDPGDYNKYVSLNFLSTQNGKLVRTTVIPFWGANFKSKIEGRYSQDAEYATFSPDGSAYAVVLLPAEKQDDKFYSEIIIVKDKAMVGTSLKKMLSGNFNLSVSEGLLNSVSEYSGLIKKDLLKISGTEPKGEFETTTEYKQRLENSSYEPLKIISKYWIKRFNADGNNKFVISLDSVGRYNADKKEYPVYFLGTEAKIPIVIEEAKDFKEKWWKTAKIEGQLGYFNNTGIPLIQNTTIKRPSDNRVYPVMIKKQAFAEYMKIPSN